MNVAAEENRVRWLGGRNGVEHALSRCRVAVPGIGPVASFALAIFLTQLRNKLFLGDDVPGRAGLLKALKQPLLLLSTEQCSTEIRALHATVRCDVASPQWRHFAGLFGPILSHPTLRTSQAAQIGTGHKGAVRCPAASTARIAAYARSRPDTRRLAGGGSLGGPSPYAPTTRWHNRSQPR